LHGWGSSWGEGCTGRRVGGRGCLRPPFHITVRHKCRTSLARGDCALEANCSPLPLHSSEGRLGLHQMGRLSGSEKKKARDHSWY
jgi:hypothetical protein